MICDRDCFNCKFEDCRLPQNDVTGDEKRFSKELDKMSVYDNSDNETQKKIKSDAREKEYRREYQRKYMNARNHGKPRTREVRVKVNCFDRDGGKIATFESLTAAANMVNGNICGIIGCCKNHRPTYKGYQWRYVANATMKGDLC